MSESLFVGQRADCVAFCHSRQGHYVYILRRPDGRPFYVGKGTGARVFNHENEARHPNSHKSNAHKLNVIRSIWRSGSLVGYEIDSWHEDEGEAYGREMALISSLKRLHEGGPLTNRDPGGGSTNGVSPFSRVRHAATLSGAPEDNPERATLNRFVLSIASMKSVVLKPLTQFTPKPTQPYPSKSMSLTLRQAAAVVASAAANSIRLDDAAVLPRTVWVDGVAGLIEDGVSCDLVTSKSALLLPASNPADEQFAISKEQGRKIVGLVGLRRCADLGVL